jgi:hypothetical protein
MGNVTALWFQHSQTNPRFYHLIHIWCDWEIHCRLCGIALKMSKSKPVSVFCVHNWDILTEITVWNLWKLTWKFWNCETPSFTIFFSMLWPDGRLTTLLYIITFVHLFFHLWAFHNVV